MEAGCRRRTFLLGLAILTLIHLLVVAYVFPPRVVFAGLPYGGGDYQTHFHQTHRLAEAFRTTGRLWAYEPQFFAGQPIGIIFDVDNKAHFLFSFLLSRLGLELASAYNLFALLSALAAPLILLLASRLLKMDRRAQLVVLALSTPIYFLDTTCRFFTSAGMISYVMTAHVSLLALVLFWRLLQAQDRHGRPFFFALLVLYPLAHLIHVWAFAILVGPSLIFYLRALRRLTWTRHAQVLAIALAVLAVNAHWLLPSLAHLDLMTSSAKLGQARPHYFLLDLFEILPFLPPSVVQTTLFRYLVLGGAAVVLHRWYRQQDERTFPGLTIVGWTLFLTYFSAYLPLFQLTEPYRFVLVLALAALLLSAPFFGELCSRAAWQEQFNRSARVLTVLALVVLVPQLGRQVLAAAPELIPRPEPLTPRHDPPPWDREPAGLEPEVTLRMKNVPDDFLEVARFLRRHCTDPGRVLVEPWEVGEFLGWASDRHIIGGFPDRRLVFEAANLFQETPDQPRFWGKKLARYLERYNIRYLVLHLPIFPMIELRRDLVQLVGRSGPYRIYRTKHRGDFFLRGSGRISAALNRITIDEVQPDPRTGTIAIRFHHLDTLRCHPACRLVREPLPDSRASFIGIVGEPQLARTITLEHRP